MDCHHPDPPETCHVCGAPVVVAINNIGACAEHLEEVFDEAAVPLGRLLAAAAEAFGPEATVDVAP